MEWLPGYVKHGLESMSATAQWIMEPCLAFSVVGAALFRDSVRTVFIAASNRSYISE
jgi:hypothetical protein